MSAQLNLSFLNFLLNFYITLLTNKLHQVLLIKWSVLKYLKKETGTINTTV